MHEILSKLNLIIFETHLMFFRDPSQLLGCFFGPSRDAQKICAVAKEGIVLTESYSISYLAHSYFSCLGAAPVFSPSSYSGTVNENEAADVTVSGITLSATDSDGDSITYSIISSAGPFKLNGAGTSVLTNGQAIDFESQDSYSLTVQAAAAGEDGII